MAAGEDNGSPSRFARRGLPMRGYLLLLVVSVLVPVLIFTGVLFARYRATEIARIEEDILADARKLALTVDRDLGGLQSTLQTLATARPLRARNYEDFYRQASEIRDVIGVDILLRDLDGQQLANTRVPWGTTLPKEPLEGDHEAIATRRPVVSGLIIGAVAQRPVYTITVPVVTNGEVTHLLNLSLLPERLTELLRSGLESSRRAGIVDRKGLLLARTERIEELLGRPATADFIRATRGIDGLWRGTNMSAEQVHAAYARSKVADWVIYVSVTEDDVQSSLTQALLALTALGAALTLIAILVAYLLGGRMAGSIRTLARQAAGLGRGQPIVPARLPVREFNDVGAALVNASAELGERERARDRAEEDLRALSETLEKKVSERTHELVSEMQRRVETEEALRQVQKMEAIGQLTGGIAHDFNNMLAVVLGSLDLAQRRLTKGDANIEEFLAGAQDGGRRAASLTQRLLAFARQQPLVPEPIDANKLLAGMSELLRRSLGETVQLETVLAAGLWRIHVDPNQLESALVNLAVNARDAMPEGGKLTIETGNAHLDDYAAAHAGVPSGQYVMIAVTDTGAGMASDVVGKAFDPFFTTKKSGAGTGLGLSQVYGFVKQSGGHVKIYSEVGAGTTIKIYLPRFFGASEAKESENEKAPTPTDDGSTTVLVVEDEEGVRRYAVDALRELGYNVLEADGGAAALRAIETHQEIALLLTDVVMPEMNGRTLAEEAARRRPSLKILFTTGYTRNAIVHNGMLDPGVNLLGKPFSLDQLGRKVAEVLRG